VAAIFAEQRAVRAVGSYGRVVGEGFPALFARLGNRGCSSSCVDFPFVRPVTRYRAEGHLRVAFRSTRQDRAVAVLTGLAWDESRHCFSVRQSVRQTGASARRRGL
jgi:hypothetical protein